MVGRRPIKWNRTVWRAGISLADPVVSLWIQCRIGPGNRIAARVLANDFPTGVHDLEVDHAGVRAKVVIDDRTGRRILAGWNLRRPRRRIVFRETDADRSCGLHEIRG